LHKTSIDATATRFSICRVSDGRQLQKASWQGTQWSLPFWYSRSRWGAVWNPPDCTGEDRLRLAIVNADSQSGFDYWALSGHVSLLLQRPVFGGDVANWILLGSFGHEHPPEGGSGFLIGRGETPHTIRAVPLWLSRSRVLCSAANPRCVLSYPLNTREESVWQLEVYDLAMGSSGKLPFWDGIAKSVGLPVAFDLTPGKERMLAYRASDGAIILADASGMKVVKSATENRTEAVPIYGYGPHPNHTDVALGPEFAAIAEGNAIVLVDLRSLSRREIVLPTSGTVKRDGTGSP